MRGMSTQQSDRAARRGRNPWMVALGVASITTVVGGGLYAIYDGGNLDGLTVAGHVILGGGLLLLAGFLVAGATNWQPRRR